MFIAFNFFFPALLGIVFLCCKVFEIAKLGSSTLLAELSFRHTFNLVRVVRVANIYVPWFAYIRTYCVPIASSNQNKRYRLLYLGDAQIIRSYFEATLARQLIQTHGMAYCVSILTSISCKEREKGLGPIPYL